MTKVPSIGLVFIVLAYSGMNLISHEEYGHLSWIFSSVFRRMQGKMFTLNYNNNNYNNNNWYNNYNFNNKGLFSNMCSADNMTNINLTA